MLALRPLHTLLYLDDAYILCVVYHSSMSDANGLVASAVYYCVLMSWSLLLYTVPYVTLSVLLIILLPTGS